MIEFSSGWVASIPSPSFNSVDVGPLTFTLYGLMIGLGIIAATTLARSRSPKRNLHPDTPLEMLVWVIPAGLIGTRIYHIITDWVPISQWHKIWEGGLGIPGGIIAGVAGGVLFTKRRGISTANVADVMAPAIPLGQAIGRIGNWWNQELYGGPTDLPWALEIDAEHRTADVAEFETFHPTFLYETLWNLSLVAFLLWLDRKGVVKRGRLIWVYAAGYAIGRLWIESVRIDNATEIFGARVNIWMMSLVLLVSIVVLSKSFKRGDEDDGDQVEANHADAKSDDGDHEDDDSVNDDDERKDWVSDTKTKAAAKSTTSKTTAKKTTAKKATAKKSAAKKQSDAKSASSDTSAKKSSTKKSSDTTTEPKTSTKKQSDAKPASSDTSAKTATKKTTEPKTSAKKQSDAKSADADTSGKKSSTKKSGGSESSSRKSSDDD